VYDDFLCHCNYLNGGIEVRLKGHREAGRPTRVAGFHFHSTAAAAARLSSAGPARIFRQNTLLSRKMLAKLHRTKTRLID